MRTIGIPFTTVPAYPFSGIEFPPGVVRGVVTSPAVLYLPHLIETTVRDPRDGNSLRAIVASDRSRLQPGTAVLLDIPWTRESVHTKAGYDLAQHAVERTDDRWLERWLGLKRGESCSLFRAPAEMVESPPPLLWKTERRRIRALQAHLTAQLEEELKALFGLNKREIDLLLYDTAFSLLRASNSLLDVWVQWGVISAVTATALKETKLLPPDLVKETAGRLQRLFSYFALLGEIDLPEKREGLAKTLLPPFFMAAFEAYYSTALEGLPPALRKQAVRHYAGSAFSASLFCGRLFDPEIELHNFIGQARWWQHEFNPAAELVKLAAYCSLSPQLKGKVDAAAIAFRLEESEIFELAKGYATMQQMQAILTRFVRFVAYFDVEREVKETAAYAFAVRRGETVRRRLEAVFSEAQLTAEECMHFAFHPDELAPCLGRAISFVAFGDPRLLSDLPNGLYGFFHRLWQRVQTLSGEEGIAEPVSRVTQLYDARVIPLRRQ